MMMPCNFSNVQVLATLTQESSKLFLKLCSVQPQGDSKFLSGIRIAHLALKHRQNRNHRMRIVLFIGSPMENVESGEVKPVAYTEIFLGGTKNFFGPFEGKN